jgi:hypothetical protein
MRAGTLREIGIEGVERRLELRFNILTIDVERL